MIYGKLFKTAKYGAGLATIAGSLYYLQKNDWNVLSVGTVRFGRAAIAATAVVFDYKYSLRGLDVTSDIYQETRSKVHTRSAVRLRRMCCKNGGCFIKVGQHLGSLEYLLPREYVDIMKVLHKEAPETSVEDLCKVFKEDLGKDVTELFAEFDKKPLAAASLAQVHKAKLFNGRLVAVKIQHPSVKSHSIVDMATMEILVNLVAWIFPEFQFKWLAEESKRNLPLELDFIHEAENCEKAAKLFGHLKFLKIPRVYWDMTTERVLTMEYFTGGFINDRKYMIDNNISVKDVMRKLGLLYSEMIFVQGYVHCDPHPGNILVQKTKNKEPQIILLDHGLYGSLSDEVRINYCRLWQGILRADVDSIQTYSEALGVGKLYGLFACMLTARSWKAVTRGVDKLSFTNAEEHMIKSTASSYLPQIAEILNTVPRELLLVFKTNDLIRGIESALHCHADASAFLTMSRCCVKAVCDDQLKSCRSRFCRLSTRTMQSWLLTKISLYELYLWICQHSLVRIVSHLLYGGKDEQTAVDTLHLVMNKH